MKWIPTPGSSSIAGFGYERRSKVLVVEFKSTGRYQYFDVPESIFRRMQAATSKGSFFSENIRGVFTYARA